MMDRRRAAMMREWNERRWLKGSGSWRGRLARRPPGTSDMGAKQVLSLGLGGDVEAVCVVDGRPSGIGWLPDGRMLVVSVADRRVLRREPDGTLSEHADISALASAPCNDMVVDQRGNAYVGNPGYDMRNLPSPRPRPSWSWCGPTARPRSSTATVMFPNGPAVTPTGAR